MHERAVAHDTEPLSLSTHNEKPRRVSCFSNLTFSESPAASSTHEEAVDHDKEPLSLSTHNEKPRRVVCFSNLRFSEEKQPLIRSVEGKPRADQKRHYPEQKAAPASPSFSTSLASTFTNLSSWLGLPPRSAYHMLISMPLHAVPLPIKASASPLHIQTPFNTEFAQQQSYAPPKIAEAPLQNPKNHRAAMEIKRQAVQTIRTLIDQCCHTPSPHKLESITSILEALSKHAHHAATLALFPRFEKMAQRFYQKIVQSPPSYTESILQLHENALQIFCEKFTQFLYQAPLTTQLNMLPIQALSTLHERLSLSLRHLQNSITGITSRELKHFTQAVKNLVANALRKTLIIPLYTQHLNAVMQQGEPLINPRTRQAPRAQLVSALQSRMTNFDALIGLFADSNQTFHPFLDEALSHSASNFDIGLLTQLRGPNSVVPSTLLDPKVRTIWQAALESQRHQRTYQLATRIAENLENYTGDSMTRDINTYLLLLKTMSIELLGTALGNPETCHPQNIALENMVLFDKALVMMLYQIRDRGLRHAVLLQLRPQYLAWLTATLIRFQDLISIDVSTNNYAEEVLNSLKAFYYQQSETLYTQLREAIAAGNLTTTLDHFEALLSVVAMPLNEMGNGFESPISDTLRNNIGSTIPAIRTLLFQTTLSAQRNDRIKELFPPPYNLPHALPSVESCIEYKSAQALSTIKNYVVRTLSHHELSNLHTATLPLASLFETTDSTSGPPEVIGLNEIVEEIDRRTDPLVPTFQDLLGAIKNEELSTFHLIQCLYKNIQALLEHEKEFSILSEKSKKYDEALEKKYNQMLLGEFGRRFSEELEKSLGKEYSESFNEELKRRFNETLNTDPDEEISEAFYETFGDESDDKFNEEMSEPVHKTLSKKGKGKLSDYDKLSEACKAEINEELIAAFERYNEDFNEEYAALACKRLKFILQTEYKNHPAKWKRLQLGYYRHQLSWFINILSAYNSLPFINRTDSSSPLEDKRDYFEYNFHNAQLRYAHDILHTISEALYTSSHQFALLTRPPPISELPIRPIEILRGSSDGEWCVLAEREQPNTSRWKNPVLLNQNLINLFNTDENFKPPITKKLYALGTSDKTLYTHTFDEEFYEEVVLQAGITFGSEDCYPFRAELPASPERTKSVCTALNSWKKEIGDAALVSRMTRYVSRRIQVQFLNALEEIKKDPPLCLPNGMRFLPTGDAHLHFLLLRALPSSTTERVFHLHVTASYYALSGIIAFPPDETSFFKKAKKERLPIAITLDPMHSFLTIKQPLIIDKNGQLQDDPPDCRFCYQLVEAPDSPVSLIMPT